MGHHYDRRVIDEALNDRELAKLNAKAIEEYWASQGHPEVWAKVKTETFYNEQDNSYEKVFNVITNLKCGLPPVKHFKPKPVKLEPTPKTPLGKMAHKVCKKHKVTIAQLKSLIRTSNVVAAKREFCRLAYSKGNSSTQIGEYLGRDHTTVLYHLKYTEGEK